MIGLITLTAFIIGLSTPDENIPTMVKYQGQIMSSNEIENLNEALTNGADYISKEEMKVYIAQAMAFIVLSLAELVHVFNVRNNKKSIFKTGILQNPKLLLAIFAATVLMLLVLLVPALRHIFGIPVIPTQNIFEIFALVFTPLIIVEIFKLLKINTLKDE